MVTSYENSVRLRELTSNELKETNGGMATVAGAAAVATGCGMVLLCLVAGVALGVGIYYGVKWLLS
jgi:hypothetical protein